MPFYAACLAAAVVSATLAWAVSAGPQRSWSGWLAALFVGWVAGGVLGAPLESSTRLSAIVFGAGDRTIVGSHLVLVVYAVSTIWRPGQRVELAAMAAAFLVGDAVGRTGCVLNGCDYGVPMPASLAGFGLRYGPGTAAYLSYPSEQGCIRDVTPALWPIPVIEGIASAALALLSGGGRLAPALVVWPLVRLALEPLRGDGRAAWCGVPNTTIFVIFSAAMGILALAILRRRSAAIAP